MNFFKGLSILFLTVSSPLLSDLSSYNNPVCTDNEYICCAKNPSQSLQLYLGPEIYHVHRIREGGAKQDGLITGVRAGYDRIKRYKLYVGFDAFYAKGTLDGKAPAGHCLKSKFSDLSVEGRFGYTLKSKGKYSPSITPYAGIGYFVEKNNFSEPSSTPIHFRTSYFYAAAGFLSQITLNDKFDLGLNFKAKFPYEAKCKVSNDPGENDSKQVINEKFQYRVELPITYKLCGNADQFRISFIPFYELRQYGHHPNYPCDFLETKLSLYGVQFKLMYCM